MPEQSAQSVTQQLDDPDQTLAAAIELIGSAQRALYLYCPQLAPALFNATEFVDALRQQAIQATRLHGLLLLPPASGCRQECPRFAALIERLSALELRTPPDDEATDKAEFGQGFLIADSKAILLMKDPRRCMGQFSMDDALTVRRLLDFFNPLWEKSQADAELRRLGL